MSLALRSLFLASLLSSAAALTQTPVTSRQVGTATLENVPEIPAEVKDSVQRYQNYREAIFRDWLPDGSMLITTRFGATSQIHRVAAPGADRTQITFFDEPIADAETIPGTSRFLFQRDTGGDEWFQLYSMGLAGQPVQLTEPGTRNQAYAFSKDGRLLAWARAIKGSGDYAILTADPANPASRRVAYQGTGAIGVADISADKGKILLERTISNRETRLSLLDLASGESSELQWTDKPARYESARFARKGAGIVTITDFGSDVRRLVDIDIATGMRSAISPPDLKWDVEVYDIAENGTTVAYAVNEDGYSRIWLYDPVSGRRRPVDGLPDGVLTGLKFSPAGDRLAISMSTAKSAGDVWVADVTGNGKITRWTNSELGPIDPATLSEPQLIRFKSFDGLSVPAFVYRPAGLPADGRTPVVIDIHGGPEIPDQAALESDFPADGQCVGRDGHPDQRSRQRRLRHALPQSRQWAEARGQRQGYRRPARLDRGPAEPR